MNEYLVGFKVESGLFSPQSRKYEKDGVKVELKLPTKDHTGIIEAIIELKAEDNLEAVNKGRIILDDLLDSTSLVMDSSLYGQEVFLILKNETGSEERVVFRSISKENVNGLYVTEESWKSIERKWKSNLLTQRMNQ